MTVVSELFRKGGKACRARVVCGLLMVTLCGCGKAKSPWETVYPAKGKVTFKGKAVPNAELAFFPQDISVPAMVRPRATSAEDGTFTVWTYEKGDGAPAGSYKVTVIHSEVVVGNGTVGAKPNDLPKKYSTPDTTDLLVEIGEVPTDIPPFELK